MISTRRICSPLDGLLIALIGVYQRRLSPRKGWRCAYSKLHGGSGCSGFVREAIETHGAWRAVPLARERFRACKNAARTLRLDGPSPGPGGSPVPPGAGLGLRRYCGWLPDACECAECIPDSCEGCDSCGSCDCGS